MTTGLHERVEYAISVCGKVFILYRKAVFLEYVHMCAIQQGCPYLVTISEISKISKMAALNAQNSKISKIPKFPKRASLYRRDFQNFPNFRHFQNFQKKSGNFRNPYGIRMLFLEILDFCATRAALLEILETCREFSARQPQITASCPIVVLSWFKLSTAKLWEIQEL